MKKKIIVSLLSVTMFAGALVACTACGPKESPDDSKQTDNTKKTETKGGDDTEEPLEYKQLTVTEPQDAAGSEFTAFSYNEELQKMIGNYASDLVPNAKESVQFADSNSMEQKLNNMFSTGNNVPDLVAVEADYGCKYIDSDYTIPVSDLGISNDDLKDMFNYTKYFATNDDMVIKGLAWQACPCGVFYNADVASTYLGIDSVEEMQEKFSTWDNVKKLAKEINDKSNGEAKIVSGEDDLFRPFLNVREKGWLSDAKNELVFDDSIIEYLELAKDFRKNDLTFQTKQFDGTAWKANASNKKVLSYWGPMWLPKFSLGLDEQELSDGEKGWRMVAPPEGADFYWGGTWLLATKASDARKTTAEVMKRLTLDETTLETMVRDGEFVNNIPMMEKFAKDDSLKIDWLGGQNPYETLLKVAKGIKNDVIGADDKTIGDALVAAMPSYFDDDIKSIEELRTTMETSLANKGVIVH